MNNNKTRNRPRSHAAFAIVLLASLTSSPRAADEPAPSANVDPVVDVEVFRAPKVLDGADKAFRYPESERRDGYEGWVHLNFMVDPQGKAVEPMVVESSGNPAFDKEALKGVQTMQFEPARRGATPVYASQDLKVTFNMYELARGAQDGFVVAFRYALKAIDAGDRVAADANLARLRVTNLYEDAYLNLCRYYYHVKWGTETEQLHDLRHATAFEKGPTYLTRSQFIQVLSSMLKLELKRQDLGDALATWTRLQPLVAKKDAEVWKPVIDQVIAVEGSDTPFHMSEEIATGTSWNGVLLKRRFRVLVTSGRVSEIKLRCERNYLFFNYDPDLEYKVDARSGRCSLELVGDPGTKFDLIQS